MSKPETMLAVTVKGGKKAVRVARPRPPLPGEVLVRVERVGICGTDLAMFDGYNPAFSGVIGHEFSGVVIEADLYSWIRRRVTASINIPPDARGSVDEAAAKHTPDRKALGIRGMDGVMAEYALLPEGILVSLPETVSWATGAMAEPLAAAIRAVDSLPDGDGPLLLIGDGRLAQLIGRVYLSRGGELHLLGRHEKKSALLEAYGAKKLNREPQERSYHRVIEATGNCEGVRAAIRFTAPTGTIVCNTTLRGDCPIDVTRLVVDEITLRGSRCGSVRQAVEEIASRRIIVEDLVTDLFPLAEAAKAFVRAVEPDALKVQLSPHGA